MLSHNENQTNTNKTRKITLTGYFLSTIFWLPISHNCWCCFNTIFTWCGFHFLTPNTTTSGSVCCARVPCRCFVPFPVLFPHANATLIYYINPYIANHTQISYTFCGKRIVADCQQLNSTISSCFNNKFVVFVVFSRSKRLSLMGDIVLHTYSGDNLDGLLTPTAQRSKVNAEGDSPALCVWWSAVANSLISKKPTLW